MPRLFCSDPMRFFPELITGQDSFLNSIASYLDLKNGLGGWHIAPVTFF